MSGLQAAGTVVGVLAGVASMGAVAASVIAKAEDTPADDGALREFGASYFVPIAAGTGMLTLMTAAYGHPYAIGVVGTAVPLVLAAAGASLLVGDDK